MEKNILKKLFSLLGVFAFVVVIVWFFYANDDLKTVLNSVNYYFLIPLVFLSLFSIYFGSFLIKFAAEPFEIELKESFALNVSSMFINLIAPLKAGAGARAIYMKKKYGLSYSNFVAALMGSYVVMIFALSVVALVAMPFLYLYYQVFSWVMFVFFFAALLICLFVILFHFTFKSKNFLVVKLNKVLEGWRLVAKFPKFIVKTFGLIVILSIINALTIVLIFKALGFEVPFLKALYINLFAIFSLFINVTPGAIGIREGLHVFAAGLVGIPIDMALLMSLVLRVINSALLFILGPIANFLLLKRFGVSLREKIEN